MGKGVATHASHSGRATSIAIILGGSIFYTWVKHVESQSPAHKPSPNGSSAEKGVVYEPVPAEDIEAGEHVREKPE